MVWHFTGLQKRIFNPFVLGSIAVIMYTEVYCDYIMGVFSQCAGLVML